MADFLTLLLAKSSGTAATIRPTLPSRFEPAPSFEPRVDQGAEDAWMDERGPNDRAREPAQRAPVTRGEDRVAEIPVTAAPVNVQLSVPAHSRLDDERSRRGRLDGEQQVEPAE